MVTFLYAQEKENPLPSLNVRDLILNLQCVMVNLHVNLIRSRTIEETQPGCTWGLFQGGLSGGRPTLTWGHHSISWGPIVQEGKEPSTHIMPLSSCWEKQGGQLSISCSHTSPPRRTVSS